MHREKNKLKQIVQTLIDATNRHDGRIHTTFEHLDNAPLLRLVCSNLQSIAEQIESLENLPLATRDIAGKVGRRRGKRCALGAA